MFLLSGERKRENKREREREKIEAGKKAAHWVRDSRCEFLFRAPLIKFDRLEITSALVKNTRNFFLTIETIQRFKELQLFRVLMMKIKISKSYFVEGKMKNSPSDSIDAIDYRE